MQCKKAHQLFGSYLDGELTFEEEESVDAHVDECPPCRKEFRGLQKTRDLLLHLPQEDPGEEFTHAVMRRVRDAAGEAPAPVTISLGERLSSWFGALLAPKPALGVASALALGLIAGFGLTQIAGTGSSDPSLTPFQAEQVTPAEVDRSLEVPAYDGAQDRFTSPVGSQQVGTAYTVRQGPGEPRVEFILEPFILRDGPQPEVAEPLFPQARPQTTGGSREGASVTF